MTPPLRVHNHGAEVNVQTNMKYLICLIAIAASCKAQETDYRYTIALPNENLAIQAIPVRVEPTPTAYTTLMDNYYKQVWQAPQPAPQIIVIQK